MLSVSNGYLKVNYYHLAHFLLCALLVFADVGLNPFSSQVSELRLDETGFSNALRQIVFLLIWVLSVVCFFKLGSVKDLLKFKGLILILLWCALSVSWAAEPAISFRRIILLSVTTTTLMMLVSIIKADSLFKVLAVLYAALLIISIVSIPVLPGAVHGASELFDTGLVGNWKGVFPHKNLAAPAICFGIIFFIYSIIKTKNYFYAPFILVGIIFIYFTQSKTSFALLFPSVFFGLMMMLVIKRSLIKNIVAIVIFVFLVLLVVLSEQILFLFLDVLNDPQAFTGRATIWNLMYLAIQDHFWFGLGYGSVWHVGEDMVVAKYAFGWVDWVFTQTQGHNSYLDLILSIGFIGFCLVFFILVIKPFYDLLYADNPDPYFVFLYFSLFFFVVFHSLLETNFLYADKGRWFLFLIMYLLLMKNSRRTCEE
ncbi:O-antigen ligase family protein [Rheinheimera sp. YQF-2]|uniref:O-antigen ligase family protein n=1 Tax=Rheinheimera lutimaris TaxID=2740584 RepID=A0A7Y5APJ3_9GAMM|nr:O-antigen ligase family protein [Rheinheimera lutimaris]NRQ42160.1 O-antigen ligase family protein [Rheinheimera lutimaris]